MGEVYHFWIEYEPMKFAWSNVSNDGGSYCALYDDRTEIIGFYNDYLNISFLCPEYLDFDGCELCIFPFVFLSGIVSKRGWYSERVYGRIANIQHIFDHLGIEWIKGKGGDRDLYDKRYSRHYYGPYYCIAFWFPDECLPMPLRYTKVSAEEYLKKYCIALWLPMPLRYVNVSAEEYLITLLSGRMNISEAFAISFYQSPLDYDTIFDCNKGANSWVEINDKYVMFVELGGYAMVTYKREDIFNEILYGEPFFDMRGCYNDTSSTSRRFYISMFWTDEYLPAVIALECIKDYLEDNGLTDKFPHSREYFYKLKHAVTMEDVRFYLTKIISSSILKSLKTLRQKYGKSNIDGNTRKHKVFIGLSMQPNAKTRYRGNRSKRGMRLRKDDHCSMQAV